MAFVTHINYVNQNGEIYCCLRNKIIPLNEMQFNLYCSSCRMNEGGEPGKKVICTWSDQREIANPYIAHDPEYEFKYFQKREVG